MPVTTAALCGLAPAAPKTPPPPEFTSPAAVPETEMPLTRRFIRNVADGSTGL
jgi:hypothetical protein